MKKIKIISLLFLMVFALAGCGKKSEIVGSDLAEALNGGVTFSEKLTEIDTTAAERRYFINAKDYSEIKAYVGTNGCCDEFVIIKCANTEGMISKLNEYLLDKAESYKEYRPNEVYKLENPFIAEYNGTVVMIITADRENAIGIYKEYLKK